MLEFEWEASKARANLRNHGISFELANTASKEALMTVVYTERDRRIRIISARRATEREAIDYFRQQKTRPKPMTPEEVERAALADADALPLTEVPTL